MKILNYVESIKKCLESLEEGGLTDQQHSLVIKVRHSISVIERWIQKQSDKNNALYHLYMSDGTYHTSLKGMDSLLSYMGVKKAAVDSALKRGSLVRGLYISKSKVESLDLSHELINDGCPFDRKKFVAFEHLTINREDNIDPDPTIRVKTGEQPMNKE